MVSVMTTLSVPGTGSPSPCDCARGSFAVTADDSPVGQVVVKTGTTGRQKSATGRRPRSAARHRHSHSRSSLGGGLYSGTWKPPTCRSSNSASRNGVRSSNIGPMICTPTGSPSTDRPAGTAVAGRPGMVASPAQTSWSK